MYSSYIQEKSVFWRDTYSYRSYNNILACYIHTYLHLKKEKVQSYTVCCELTQVASYMPVNLRVHLAGLYS